MREGSIMKLYRVIGYWIRHYSIKEADKVTIYIVASDAGKAEKLALGLVKKVDSISPIAATNVDGMGNPLLLEGLLDIGEFCKD